MPDVEQDHTLFARIPFGSERLPPVKLEVFEGPLDLLLHLVRKNEIDIFDIPIATIAHQYLEYIQLLKMLDLEIAGDFLVMAATLMRIKVRMLLPQIPDEEGEEAGDPRAELVAQLLEYRKFKGAAGHLAGREEEARELFPRGAAEPDRAEGGGEQPVGLFDLLGALQDVIKRLAAEERYQVGGQEVSVEECIRVILDRLAASGEIAFTALFDAATTRLQIIAMFLALLELVRARKVVAVQREMFDAIVLRPAGG
jgi:segregation and condensation protein A